ncbi:MAG: M15 family metallopeptidase [Brevinematales bacterium]|nr:M15 family metallopeptidase [Brevinematales bacterium]
MIKKVLIFIIIFSFVHSIEDSLISKDIIQKEHLVDIQKLDPTIKVKLMYATTNNFLKKNVYGNLTNCYLRLEAAIKLTNAQRILKKINPDLTLLIYDGLRPRRIQYMMWDIVKNTPEQQYVANPKGGSIHNFGCAVDLTIAYKDGEPLDMGTPFDYFGVKAQPRFEEFFVNPEKLSDSSLDKQTIALIKKDIEKLGRLTATQLSNRLLLRKVMTEAGFNYIANEWWHFEAFPREVVKKKYTIIE